MSGLPAWAHATGADPVSTAGGMGPLGTRAWTGHLIEEGGEAGSDHVSLTAGLYSLEGRCASTIVARRLDRGHEATPEVVSSPETGAFATRQPLLPTSISPLHGAKRVPAPNNRHSLRGFAQANSMCSPHVRHLQQRGSLCLGAPHRILMSYVTFMVM